MAEVKRCQAILLAIAALLMAACSDAAPETGTPPSEGQITEMMAVPPKLLRRCRSTPTVGRICPTRVPQVDPTSFRRFQALQTKPPAFNFEWGGPRPGLSARNAPPEMVHVVVQAGDIDSDFGFPWPPKEPPAGPLKEKRRASILLGRHTWDGREGTVVLAPPYPFGGVTGDHVVFTWSEHGLDYAVSLHAWTPVRETVAALREVVRSIP